MKKIFFIPFLFSMLILSGCSENEDSSNKPTTSDEKEWLDVNIVGTWKATDTWNGISGIWADTSLGWPDAQFEFKSDGTVEVADFNVDEGVSDYEVGYEDYSTYIVINGHKRTVMSIDESTESMTLYNYAKLKKIN